MIIEHTGSLFDAPKKSLLVHACNSLGVWGGGIAVEFKQRFPDAFDDYHAFCTTADQETLVGSCLIYDDTDYSIASLITSHGYGSRKDPPSVIVDNTRVALDRLFEELAKDPETEIHSPRFNAGLFAVPWTLTRATIEAAMIHACVDFKWHVWTPPT